MRKVGASTDFIYGCTSFQIVIVRLHIVYYTTIRASFVIKISRKDYWVKGIISMRIITAFIGGGVATML